MCTAWRFVCRVLREVFTDSSTRTLSSSRLALLFAIVGTSATLYVLLVLALQRTTLDPALGSAIAAALAALATIATGGYTANVVARAVKHRSAPANAMQTPPQPDPGADNQGD